MKYKNSFFRLDIKEDGTYLDIYPPVNDGKKLEIKEIVQFIEEKGCKNYSIDLIKKSLEKANDSPVSVKVSDNIIEHFSESAKVIVSPDRMVAYIRFYPPSSKGAFMTKREILSELERKKITFGISEKIVEVFLSARQYCLNIPVVKGQKPVFPVDSRIEYLFNIKPLAKPKVLEDGSVDFHTLSLFTKVSAGDVLAKLIPAVDGQPGKDIFGNVIPVKKPKIKRLKYGKNIKLSGDGLSIISEVSGNVTLTDNTVFVSDPFNVAADVDASTGDIEYDGNVYIPGTVRTGFTVKAKGDIQVDGVVEGATLIAGGNIVIKRGVQGMGKGILKAGGDICAQFFESSTVEVEGDVIVGSIIHSSISSNGSISVNGKKGFIVGGEIICKKGIEVNSIGNKMETQTIIKVGVNLEVFDKIKTLVGEVAKINPEIEEVSSYLNVYKTKLKNGLKLSPDNIKQIKEYTSRLNSLEEERDVRNNELASLKEILDEGKQGSIKVAGSTYRGVSIFIASSIYIVKERESHCIYKIVDGEIEPTSF